MIEQLTIDGYKSIRHQLIALKQMNVLAGLNSSGKSSVIQALRILGRVAQKRKNYFQKTVATKTDCAMCMRSVWN